MRVSAQKRLGLAMMMALLGTGAFAQADVDSPYSVFGVGQLSGKTMNVRLKGMGGLANGMYGGTLINTANPASYAKMDSLAFLFDAGLYFKNSDFSTSNLSERSSNASFNQMFVAFGLTGWWKAALGVRPYSNMGYTMIVDSHDAEVGNYSTAFMGSGGLNEAVIGNAFRLGRHFALGVNVNYVFGDSETMTTLYFPDSTFKIGSRRSVDMMVSSFKFDYGLLFNATLGDGYSLGVGLTYDQRVRLRGKQTTYLRTIASDGDMTTGVEYLIDTVYYRVNDTARLTMPQGFGAGFVIRKDNKWGFGVDFDWTQWSRFAREGANDSLGDAWRVAAGFEYMPTYSSVSNYFRRMTYRVGGFYERTCLNLRGHALDKMGVTVGASLPLPRSQSKVNVAVEVGRCGTKLDGLVQENYIRVDVGVSVAERWFMKRKYK